jgi:hypothetical protein
MTREEPACWRKSSYSHANGDCVEVTAVLQAVGVRDSKQHGSGPVLEFRLAAWRAFIVGAKLGRV